MHVYITERNTTDFCGSEPEIIYPLLYTQRVLFFTFISQIKAYAIFLTDEPQLDSTFIGKAITGNGSVYGRVHGVSIKYILIFYHIVPFFAVFIILALFYICVMYALCYKPCSKPCSLCCKLCSLCCKLCASWRGNGAYRRVDDEAAEPVPAEPVPSNSVLFRIYNIIKTLLEDGLTKKIIKPIKKKPQKQANVVSVVVVCIMLSSYITALDVASLIIEKKNDLPKYNDINNDIFICTTVFASISVTVLIAGFVMPAVVWLCFSCCCKDFKDAYKKDQKVILYFVIPIYLIVSSTLLSLAYHFQNILLAWVTNPFYASNVAILYSIIIFLDLLVFKYVYTIPLAFARLLNLGDKGTRVVAFFGVICVILSGFVLIGLQATIVVLLIYIPINNSLEESANGISAMYDGVFLFFGGIIAYNIGGLYFRRKFSIEKAVKKAMKAMINTPFDGKDIEKAEEWKGYTEQKKLKEIIKALLQRETRKGPMYPYSDENFVMVPQSEGQGAFKHIRIVAVCFHCVLPLFLYSYINTALIMCGLYFSYI